MSFCYNVYHNFEGEGILRFSKEKLDFETSNKISLRTHWLLMNHFKFIEDFSHHYSSRILRKRREKKTSYGWSSKTIPRCDTLNECQNEDEINRSELRWVLNVFSCFEVLRKDDEKLFWTSDCEWRYVIFVRLLNRNNLVFENTVLVKGRKSKKGKILFV